MDTKRRRKPVKCAICKEDTLDIDGVCGYCRHNAALGKKLAATEDDSNAERKLTTLINRYFKPPSLIYWRYGDAREKERKGYDELAAKLDSKHYEIEDEIHRIMVELTGTDTSAQLGNLDALITEKQEYAFFKLRAAIAMLCADSRAEGEQRGGRFLQKLVAGELSMEELQAQR